MPAILWHGICSDESLTVVDVGKVLCISFDWLADNVFIF